MPRTKHRGPSGRYSEKLNNMCQSIDNYTKILVESMLYDLRQAMNERILTAAKNTGPEACDDRVYDSYTRLMQCYRKASEEYESVADVLVSPRIKNIMDGIHSVISSRLGLNELPNFAENPIFIEKRAIINTCMDNFGKSFENLGARFMSEELPRCREYARELFVTFNENTDYDAAGLSLAQDIADRQNALLGDSIRENYAEAVEGCEALLNDIDVRGEILRYSELLEQERQILNTLVDIQIPRLENDRGCSPNEENVVACILGLITDAYAGLQKDVGDPPGGAPKIPETVGASLWNDVMLEGVLAATNYAGFAKSLKAELTEVWQSLEYDIGIITEREVSNRLYARAMYEYRKLVTSHILMSEEMLKAFEALAAAGREVLATIPEGDARMIIDGITETMQIKIESIQENAGEFAKETSERLKKMRKERPRLILSDLGELVPEIGKDTLDTFFQSYRHKMQRHINSYQEFAAKKCMTFKKEHLLFEVVTFEEIINYSVSRIKDEVCAQEYVACVNETWAALKETLGKHQISPIAPCAHDMFNGREHEVLMAEKNPDFKKGEIIKLMNCGYKQDDVVLIRANVVAAV